MTSGQPKPKEGRGKMFDNPIMDRLTRTHIAVPLTIFYGAAAGIVIYTLYWGLVSTEASIIAVVSGFLFFTLAEYLIHRYTFHMETPTPARIKVQHLIHGVHHDYPKDKSRLAMPPLLSISLATGFLIIYRLTMGQFGMPFTAGFMAGYASYLSVHYSVHALRPPNNFLKVLWVHHAIHHYQDHDRAFGVSSPFWDVIFRTMPVKNNKFSVETKSGFIDDREEVKIADQH